MATPTHGPYEPNYPTSIPSPAVSPRPASIAIASVLFALIGLLSVIGGIALVAIGGLSSSIPFFGYYLGGFVSLIGVVALATGVIRLLGAFWLWDLQVKGGIVALVMILLSFLMNGALLLLGNFLATIDLAADLAVLILVAVGWRALR